MIHDLTVFILTTGLLMAIWFFISARRKVNHKPYLLSGIFNFGCALLAVLPAILIKLDVIDQTTVTVMLAILYFLVFIIGAMLVDSKAIRLKHHKDK